MINQTKWSKQINQAQYQVTIGPAEAEGKDGKKERRNEAAASSYRMKPVQKSS